MNLWPFAGLCNGSTGAVIDIINTTPHKPPLYEKIPFLVALALSLFLKSLAIQFMRGNSYHLNLHGP